MKVLANGFLPFHIEVNVHTGSIDSVAQHIKSLNSSFRRNKTWPNFPHALIEHIKDIRKVDSVTIEGPQSASLIPLRMVKGLSNSSCEYACVLGTGEISDAIESYFREWGIKLTILNRIPDADSPLEFSIREPGGASMSIKLYPDSRNRYKTQLGKNIIVPDKLILTRTNVGLKQLATMVQKNKGTVSLRIRDFGRYDPPSVYEDIFGITNQIVLSTRNGVLAKLGRHFNIDIPRKWPSSPNLLEDEYAKAIANRLFTHLPDNSIIVFTGHTDNTTTFYKYGHSPITIFPAGNDPTHASLAARIQGALLTTIVTDQSKNSESNNEWKSICQKIMSLSYLGTDTRPWQYNFSKT
jgi:hypothetical protein